MSDEQQRGTDAPEDGLDAPMGGGTTDLPDDVAALLGEAAEALAGLATQAAEAFTVGVESVSGQPAPLADVSARVSTFDAMQQELAAEPHMAFEVQVAIPGDGPQTAAAFVGLDDLGALLSVELGAEQMADEEFAAAQGETVAQSVRELLDLVSITLFSEGLSGVEATLAGHRSDAADITLATLADRSGSGVALRLDATLNLPSGQPVRVLVVLPPPLLERLAALLGVVMAAAGSGEAGASLEAGLLDDGGLDELFDDADGPTPLRRKPADEDGELVAARAGGGAQAADERGDGFGLSSDPNNVSRLRTAGTFGATTGDDVDVHPVRFPSLAEQGAGRATAAPAQFDLIMDVSMRISVELGRSTMTVEEVLSLGPGSVVELNKLAGEPVDIMVNDRLIARGEVVVVDENFGVRVTEIVSPRRRMHAMGAAS